MAAYYTEDWSKRKLVKAASGWTADREFQVIQADTETDALAATLVSVGTVLPVMNDAHPASTFLLVDSVSVDQAVGFKFWTVKVHYSIPKDGQAHDGPGAQDNPLLEPPRIRWEFGASSEPIDRDINGNPIVNSAGDPFQQPVTRDFTTIFLVYTRNEPFFNVNTAITYSNKTNSGSIIIAGAGQVAAGQMMCKSIAPASDYSATAQFVPVSYRFELRADGFKARMLDQGLRAWYTNPTTSDVELAPLVTRKLQPITQPVRFDGTGEPIAATAQYVGDGVNYNATVARTTPAGATLDNAALPEAVFLKYTIYGSADFLLLNL